MTSTVCVIIVIGTPEILIFVVPGTQEFDLVSNFVEHSFRMRAALLWLVIKDTYTHEGRSENEISSSKSSKWTWFDVKDFSYREVSLLVAVLTSTYSKQGSALTVARYWTELICYLTFVFIEALCVLSSSSWTTKLHFVVLWLTQSCWRLRIFSALIDLQGLRT